MHRLIPRHRRKAGSGPPANALIAWIGTDPYLRDAAATASYRRWMALPTPSNTRSAGAAVVACFALACAGVVGITAIISHGRATAQHKIATPSLFGQGGAPTPGPESSLTFPTEGSGVSPAPAGIAPMLTERAAPQPIAVSPPAKNVDQVPGHHLSNSQGGVSTNATTAPVPAIPARHIDKPGNSGKPVEHVETVAVGKPSDSSKSSDTHALPADSTPGDPDPPTNPGPLRSAKLPNPAVLTIPGTDRARSATSEPTPMGRSDGTGAQGGSGDPDTDGLPQSPRRSPPGVGSDSAHSPSSRGGSTPGGDSTTGHSSISRQGSAPTQRSTSSRSSRSSRE